MRDVAIIGVGIHPFGRFAGKEFTEIGQVAVLDALRDAGIPWKEVQAAFCGNMTSGTAAGHRVLARVGMTGIPIVNVENACASGGSALRLATQAVATGLYDVALAFGVEKMPRGFMAMTSYDRWQMLQGMAINPIGMALNTRWHMDTYGTTAIQLAKVSVKSHKNGALNPNAMYRKALSLEEIMNSPMVCDPLRLLMLCAPDEGAAAAIVTTGENARKYTSQPVFVAAAQLGSPLYGTTFGTIAVGGSSGSARMSAPEVSVVTAQKAYEQAGLGPQDLGCVELQDTESGSEIIYYEQLGLCGPGEGGRLLDEGATEINGRIPVNTSGGLIAKGEPVGASSLGQVHELVLQLRGQAGQRQVAGARVGLSHTVGAGGNCSVIILKR
ncbi:MAG: thiolase family protein [Chloroflexi bacterium]|nr:thiolase family protein [Chloroflexota bacterium]